jgi:hypothetical protein
VEEAHIPGEDWQLGPPEDEAQQRRAWQRARHCDVGTGRRLGTRRWWWLWGEWGQGLGGMHVGGWMGGTPRVYFGMYRALWKLS